MTVDSIMPWVALLVAVAAPVASFAAVSTRVSRAERDIEKLDGAKASKESVDGLHDLLERMQLDMDKRLDRIERLLVAAVGREDTRP